MLPPGPLDADRLSQGLYALDEHAALALLDAWADADELVGALTVTADALGAAPDALDHAVRMVRQAARRAAARA